MKFCANLSLLFTELPLLERFAAARSAGFEAVEIQFPYSTPLEDLVAVQQASQLKVVLINVAAGDLMEGGEGLAAVPGKRSEFSQALAQCFRYAQALNVECVNVLPGRCFDHSQQQDYLATLRDNLLLSAETLSPLGVTTTFEAINTEDMPDVLIHSYAQMCQILDEVQHPALAMQYDIYHMSMMAEPVLEQLSQTSSDKHPIGHIQFADKPGRHQPGTGTLDFETLFNTIERSTYQGWLGAEYKPTGRSDDSLTWLARHKNSGLKKDASPS